MLDSRPIESGGELTRLWDLLTHRREDDDAWHEDVGQVALDAPLETLDSGAFAEGPDGFPYAMMRFPRTQSFAGSTLRSSLKDLVGKMGGFAIHDTHGNPMYVFSHGDILSLSLYSRLLVKWGGEWDTPTRAGVLSEAKHAFVGSPSEEMLPPLVARSVGRLMKLVLGIEKPKVVLVQIDKAGPSDLIFNVFRDDFEREEAFRWAMGAINLFLPRHLRKRLIFMDRSAFPREMAMAIGDA